MRTILFTISGLILLVIGFALFELHGSSQTAATTQPAAIAVTDTASSTSVAPALSGQELENAKVDCEQLALAFKKKRDMQHDPYLRITHHYNTVQNACFALAETETKWVNGLGMHYLSDLDDISSSTKTVEIAWYRAFAGDPEDVPETDSCIGLRDGRQWTCKDHESFLGLIADLMTQ